MKIMKAKRPSIQSLMPTVPKKIDFRSINPKDIDAFEEIQEEEEVFLLRSTKKMVTLESEDLL